MANIAVITALQPRADLPAHPRGALDAGGITLLERNVRLLRGAGARIIYILTDDQFAVLTPLVSQLGKANDIRLIGSALDLTNSLSDDDSVMALDEGVLLDERLVAAVATDDAPHCIAVFPSLAPEHERAVRIDPEYSFASVLKAPGKVVRDVCRGLGDWDFVHTLLRTLAAQPGVHMLEVPGLETYVEDRRRCLPILWQPMKAASDQPAALERLLEAAQPHVLDWPARFLHPLVENHLVRLLLPTVISPIMAALLAATIGLLAALAFAKGWLWAGLVLALALGPLEGLADKLTHVRAQFSRLFQPLSWLRFLPDMACYAGLAWNFYENNNLSSAWPVFLLISLSSAASLALHGFYRRFTGRQLHDAGATERHIRLFAGQRSTFFWALLPFAVADMWWLGYKFIALYAVATFFLAQLRFFVRLKEFGVLASSAIAANFERTDTGILRRRKTGSR